MLAWNVRSCLIFKALNVYQITESRCFLENCVKFSTYVMVRYCKKNKSSLKNTKVCMELQNGAYAPGNTDSSNLLLFLSTTHWRDNWQIKIVEKQKEHCNLAVAMALIPPVSFLLWPATPMGNILFVFYLQDTSERKLLFSKVHFCHGTLIPFIKITIICW